MKVIKRFFFHVYKNQKKCDFFQEKISMIELLYEYRVNTFLLPVIWACSGLPPVKKIV